MKPTEAYWQAIEAGKEHHRNSNTWSGGLAVRHGERIKNMIDRLGVQSVLDYGAGKGIQYTHLFSGKPLEEYWGVPVYKYDPALPQDWRGRRGKFNDLKIEVHNTLPEGQTWDLVVATHSLG